MITERNREKLQTVDFRGRPVEVESPAAPVFAAFFELLNSENGVREATEAVLNAHRIELRDAHGEVFWPGAE